MLISPCQADTWSQSLLLPASIEYDTNPTLSALNAEAGLRYRFAPKVSAEGVWGDHSVNVDASVNVEQNLGGAALNRQDPGLGVAWTHQWLTGQMGLSARYSRVAVRTASIDELEEDNSDGTRVTRAVAANGVVMLAERTHLAASVGQTHSSYQNSFSSDYTRLSASASLHHQWDETIGVNVSLNAGRYDSDARPSSDSWSLATGFNAQLTERFSWEINLGLSDPRGIERDSRYFGATSFNYRYQKSQLGLGISRSVFDNGVGSDNTADQLTGSFSYQFSERTNLVLSGAWREMPATNSEVKTFSSSLSRELTPYLNARVGWSYKERAASSLVATGNVLSFSLVYTDPAL